MPFSPLPPPNEIKSLAKPTGMIKAFVKPGKRKQGLQEMFTGWLPQVPWRCGHWRCWGQGSSTGSPIQPTNLWKLWAVQFPVLPLGTLRSPASCQRPKITQVLWRVEIFQDTNCLALLRFASFPNKNLKSWNSLKTMGKYNFCSGFWFYFKNQNVCFDADFWKVTIKKIKSEIIHSRNGTFPIASRFCVK